jgi:NADH-quinone oxidoreductase subunit M
VDSSLKLYYQIDLKKLIAYATVVEMHWLTLALLNGQSIMWLVSFAMLVSHALLSSNFFFLIDSVTRRFKTRLLTEISGLVLLTPKLYFSLLVLLVTFLGFPGSLFFIAEFLFFSYLLDINVVLTFALLTLLYFFVASCYFKNWFFIMFNISTYWINSKLLNDVDAKEYAVFMFFTLLVYFLGFTNQFLF